MYFYICHIWVLGPESNAKCSIYHIFCLRHRPGPSEYQFIIDHSPASRCCSLCAVLTLKYHSLRDPLCGRNKWKSLAISNSRAGALPDNCLKSESQYKVSRFGNLEHKLCKSLNKDFIIASSVVWKKCCKLEQHLSQGCKLFKYFPNWLLYKWEPRQ